MNIYYSQMKSPDLGQRHPFILRGYGDFIVRNSIVSIYSSPETSMASIARFGGTFGQQNKTFILLLENIYITNAYLDRLTLNSGSTYLNLMGGSTFKLNITLSNVTLDRIYGSESNFNIFLRPGPNNNVFLKDVTIKNVESNIPVIMTEPMSNLIIENMNIIN